MTDPVATFYDALAPDFHRIFENWDQAIAHQGEVLTRLLSDRGLGPPAPIYDAACGIGTQAIALAERGYRVAAGDLSAAAVAQASSAARDRGLDITFAVADLRLPVAAQAGAFDAVIAFDNSIAHLAPGPDLAAGLGAMAVKLRPGGLLALSLRDYDALRATRPSLQPTRATSGPDGRSITLQLWDWAEDGSCYDMQHFVLVEETAAWRLAHQSTRLYAIGRATLEQASRAAGLAEVEWLMPDDSGYYQPILLARRDDG